MALKTVVIIDLAKLILMKSKSTLLLIGVNMLSLGSDEG